MLRLLLCLPVLVALVTPAFASDGILEISQACIGAGCFPGDASGLPITITQPGSYRLTSNLSRTLLFGQQQLQDFIKVEADSVHIDLGGFTISCALAVVGSACSGAGSGIVAVGFTATSVSNGQVHQMGDFGLRLGAQASVRDFTAIGNGDTGIRAGVESRVVDCTARGNGDNGIAVGFDSRVRDSVAVGNGAAGIRLEAAGVVTGSVANSNGQEGFFASGALVQGNQATANGEAGIRVSTGGLVIGNRVASNDGVGLQLTNTGYRENVMTGNADLFSSTDEVTGGIQLGPNICDSAPCP